MKKIALITPIFLGLVSCAAGYYPANGIDGSGYSEFKVSNNTYVVQYQGNSSTSSDRAYTYALRRAADLTKQRGYKYFKVISSSSKAYQSSYRTPVVATTTTTDNNNMYQYYSTSTSTTTYSGGELVTLVTPVTKMTIQFHHQLVHGALDADVILTNFQKKS